MRSLPRPRWFMVSGLLVLVVSYLVPIQLPYVSRTQSVCPVDSPGFDIKFNLLPGEFVNVSIRFDSNIDPDLCKVWGIVTYQYPTKSIGETADDLRFDNQLEVDFIFGWKDVRLNPIFVTGFIIRIYYSGEDATQVSVILTKHANVIPYTGIGILIFSALQLIVSVLITKLKYNE